MTIASASDYVTPELIISELLNARWKVLRSGAHASALVTMLELLERFHFVPTLPRAAGAEALAYRVDNPVSDCLGAAIAAREQSQFLTADRCFARKLSAAHIDVAIC